MSIKQRYDENVMKKIAARFSNQLEYAVRVVFQTYSDELDKQANPDSTESKKAKLMLERATCELLGDLDGNLEGYTEEQQHLIKTSRDVINRFKSEIMGSQQDVREYIVQTNRMVLILYGRSDPNGFRETLMGKAVTEVLNKYGAEFPRVTVSLYESICESVAAKTNTVDLYKEMVKRKQA